MTVYIDKLDDLFNKLNNTYHSTIKMKSAKAKDNTYIDFDKKDNTKVLNLKLEIMLEYRNTKKSLNYWGKFCDYKAHKHCPMDVISNLNDEKKFENFYEKEWQKINQREIKIKKVIMKKGGKIYVKCKGYDNLFTSWIDKKNTV